MTSGSALPDLLVGAIHPAFGGLGAWPNVAVAKNRVLLDGRCDNNDMEDAANVADQTGQGRCIARRLPT